MRKGLPLQLGTVDPAVEGGSEKDKEKEGSLCCGVHFFPL